MERGKKRLLLVLLGGAHSLNHSLFLVLPLFLLTIVDEFSTSVEIIGFVSGASYFIYGAGGIVGGQLSDRFGEAKTITVSLALSGVSTLIFLVAHDFTMLVIGLLLIAAFASLYHAIANSFISKVFQPNMAKAMGIHGTGGNVGYMFAPIIAVALGTMWGWRISFLFFGILSVIVSILVLKMSPSIMKETRTEAKFWDIVRIPKLWTLIIFNMAIGLFYKGVDFILPTFLETQDLPPAIMASALTAILAVGILGQWLSGKASDAWSSKKVLIATSAGTTFGLFCLLAVSLPVVAILIFILIYGFFFYGHQPAFNALAGLITPDNLRGTVFGVLFFFSFGLGSISTAMAGIFADRYSLESALYIMMMFSFAAFLLSFLVPAQTKRSRGQDK
ncbi:MAG: MFS transporter [Candidatus Bathyarchaeota archaeon]|nr:MAG: MFS transporter [Candidatus Bathyarchaeota archaeon]